jgi:hypothetical protein
MPASIPNVTPRPPVATRPPPSAPGRRLKHRLLACEAVVGEERPADFEAYRDEVLAVLRPVGVVEEDLTEMMVMCQWKLRRLWRFETAQHIIWKGRGEKRGMSPFASVILAFLADCREGRCTERFSQREAHLMRGYLRAESRLRLRQAERREGPGAGAAEDTRIDPQPGAGCPAPRSNEPQPAAPPLAAAWADGAPHAPDPGPASPPTEAAAPAAAPTPSSDCIDMRTWEITNRLGPPRPVAPPPGAAGAGGIPMAAD